MKPMHAMQADTPDKGKLKIQINSEITSFPIADAPFLSPIRVFLNKL